MRLLRGRFRTQSFLFTKTHQKNVDCLSICLTRDVSLSLDINIVHAAEWRPDWPVTDLWEKQ